MNDQAENHDEEARLSALDRFDILDSPAEQVFDDLAQLAAQICETPIALITLVDDRRQWFKSRVGLDATETPKDIAFCAHTIKGTQIMEVPNALQDERFFNNPLVTGEPNIRFYAGAPIITTDGFRLGTVAVIDRNPRQLKSEQKLALERISREVIKQMELRIKNNQLQEKVAFENALMNSTAYSIISTDKNGLITSFNHASEKLLNYHSDEIVHQVNIIKLFDKSELAKQAQKLSPAQQVNKNVGLEVLTLNLDMGDNETREWKYINKAGNPVPILLTVTAVKNEKDVITGYLYTALELTDASKKSFRKSTRNLIIPLQATPVLITTQKFRLRLLILTVSYLLLASIGWLLAIPPGYSSPIWPAAGLAVAVILVWGWRYWPGIWFGSFCFNIFLDFSVYESQGLTEVTMLAALIAIGDTLQALIGAYLTRHFLKNSDDVSHELDLFFFLIFAGPLACVTSATISSSSLYLFNRIAIDEYFSNWLTWWVGNSIGVILFTPLVFLFLPESRRIWRDRSTQITPAILIAFALLATCMLGFNYFEESMKRIEARDDAKNSLILIHERLSQSMLTSQSINSFFAASEFVTRQEFNNFTEKSLIQGIQAIEWIPKVSNADRARMESAIQQEGFVDFQFKESIEKNKIITAKIRSEYFPILYLEPLAGNERALGFDLASDVSRNSTMELARDSALATATELLELVQGKKGVLVFSPLYKHGFNAQTATIWERQDALRGYTLLVFDINALISPLIKIHNANHHAYRLWDITSDISPSALFNFEEPHEENSTPLLSEQIDFFGRQWQLDIFPTSNYWINGQSLWSQLFYSGCLLSTFLFSLLVLTMSGRDFTITNAIRTRTKQLKMELTARRAIESNLLSLQDSLIENRQKLEQTMDIAKLVNWQCDLITNTYTFNDRFYKMLGTTAEREGGYQMPINVYLQKFIHPDDRERTQAQMLKIQEKANRESNGQLEYRIVRHDGKVSNILVRYRIITDSAGRGIIIMGANQDITEVKEIKLLLDESENRFNVLFHASPTATILSQLETGEFIDVNEQFLRLLGRKRKDLIGFTSYDLKVWGDDPSFRNKLVSTLNDSNGRVQNKEFVIYNTEGKRIEVSGSASLIMLGGKESVLTTLTDISTRKRAEDELNHLNQNLAEEIKRRSSALVQSEERMHLLLENLAEGVVACDADGKLILFNKAAREWHGMDPMQIPAEQWAEYYDLYEDDGITQLSMERIPLIRAYNGEHVRNAKISIVRKDMPSRLIVASGEPLFDLDGKKRGAVVVMHDVTEQQKAQREMRQALVTLDATDDGIFIFEPNMLRFIYVNEGAVRQLGYSREELLNMSPADIKTNFWEVEYPTMIQRMQRGEFDKVRFTTKHKHKDGNETPVEINLHYVSHKGLGMRFISVARDITDRQSADNKLKKAAEDLRAANKAVENERRLLEKRVVERTTELSAANEQLQNAMAEADLATRAKSAFLATMSHEIRTPMNGVIGMVDILANSDLTDDQRDAVMTIRESAFSLLHVIDEILDFSKIEAGHLKLEKTTFSIKNLSESICDSLLPVADKKRVELDLFVDPNIPQHVLSDPTRLRQILNNLIGNALKFSSGRPDILGRICLRVEMKTANPLQVKFSVSDNGIGIEPSILPKLFDSFTQAEISTTRRFGGAGLGLAICKRLSDLMQGEIEVSSELGKGSVFNISLPFEVAALQPEISQPDLSNLHCILVESTELNFNNLKAYLEHAGAQVKSVTDMQAGIAQAKTLSTRVVIIQKGNQTNFELDDNLSALENVNILFLTKGRRRKARINPEDVVTLDTNALRQQSLLRAVAVASGLASPEIIHERINNNIIEDISQQSLLIDPTNIKDKLILVAEDDQINQKVILNQLTLLGYATEIANNGQEALKMWREGNYDLVLTDIHMPEMDGYELTENIRQEEKDTHIPIVALTANALRSEIENANKAGMDLYLTKPVQLQILQDALAQYFPDNKNKTFSTDQKQVTKNNIALDLNILKGLVGNDDKIICELLNDFLIAADNMKTTLHEFAKTKATHDFAATAHKFKSASRSVGAVRLGELCAELEDAGKKADKPVIITKLLSKLDSEVKKVKREIKAILEVSKHE